MHLSTTTAMIVSALYGLDQDNCVFDIWWRHIKDDI